MNNTSVLYINGRKPS